MLDDLGEHVDLVAIVRSVGRLVDSQEAGLFVFNRFGGGFLDLQR